MPSNGVSGVCCGALGKALDEDQQRGRSLVLHDFFSGKTGKITRAGVLVLYSGDHKRRGVIVLYCPFCGKQRNTSEL